MRCRRCASAPRQIQRGRNRNRLSTQLRGSAWASAPGGCPVWRWKGSTCSWPHPTTERAALLHCAASPRTATLHARQAPALPRMDVKGNRQCCPATAATAPNTPSVVVVVGPAPVGLPGMSTGVPAGIATRCCAMALAGSAWALHVRNQMPGFSHISCRPPSWQRCRGRGANRPTATRGPAQEGPTPATIACLMRPEQALHAPNRPLHGLWGRPTAASTKPSPGPLGTKRLLVSAPCARRSCAAAPPGQWPGHQVNAPVGAPDHRAGEHESGRDSRKGLRRGGQAQQKKQVEEATALQPEGRRPCAREGNSGAVGYGGPTCAACRDGFGVCARREALLCAQKNPRPH